MKIVMFFVFIETISLFFGDSAQPAINMVAMTMPNIIRLVVSFIPLSPSRK